MTVCALSTAVSGLCILYSDIHVTDYGMQTFSLSQQRRGARYDLMILS
jgi:hypothetical protein